jgi:hypothetical protein
MAKKSGLLPAHLADLMFFYVESGTRFTVEYGDMDESFYISMESMYLTSLKFITKEDLLSEFEARARKIVDDAADVGWGFPDTLGDYYHQYF